MYAIIKTGDFYMKQFWQESYFNRKNWLMENIVSLNLSEREFMLLMLITFFMEQNRLITTESLSAHSNLSIQDVDDCLSQLCLKQYLQVTFTNGIMSFNMDGIFQQKEKDVDALPIFQTFEQEFGRPLTQKELMMLSEWIRKYDNELIIYALREAAIYRKLNIKYIDTILSRWEKQGITVEKLVEDVQRESE